MVLALHFVASFCPELRSGAARRFWLWRLCPSENRSEYRFTNTQKRIFHTCVHYGAYPWIGIFGEGSILMPLHGRAPSPCLSFRSRLKIQGVVWNFNKRPICATLFVVRSFHPRSPVKHADLHDDRQIQKCCDDRGQGKPRQVK